MLECDCSNIFATKSLTSPPPTAEVAVSILHFCRSLLAPQPAANGSDIGTARHENDPRLVAQREREDEFIVRKLEESDLKRRKIEVSHDDDAMHDMLPKCDASLRQKLV